jgi:hypothetical protein
MVELSGTGIVVKVAGATITEVVIVVALFGMVTEVVVTLDAAVMVVAALLPERLIAAVTFAVCACVGIK